MIHYVFRPKFNNTYLFLHNKHSKCGHAHPFNFGIEYGPGIAFEWIYLSEHGKGRRITYFIQSSCHHTRPRTRLIVAVPLLNDSDRIEIYYYAFDFHSVVYFLRVILQKTTM